MNAEAKAVGRLARVLPRSLPRYGHGGRTARPAACRSNHGSACRPSSSIPTRPRTRPSMSPIPSGPPIPKAGAETVRPLQSTPPPDRCLRPSPSPPQPMTIGEIVAANVETPEKICSAVTPIIMAEPGDAFDLIETARQRPKQMEVLAQCLSQIQTMIKRPIPTGPRRSMPLWRPRRPHSRPHTPWLLPMPSSGDARIHRRRRRRWWRDKWRRDGGSSSGGGGDGGGGGGGGRLRWLRRQRFAGGGSGHKEYP